MNFYALYSKSQKCYNTPFLAHDDKEAIAIISKTVVSHQDPSLVMSLDDLRIDLVGEFVSDVSLPGSAPIVEYSSDLIFPVLDDLHKDLPLPPMVKSQVEKLYSKKEVV